MSAPALSGRVDRRDRIRRAEVATALRLCGRLRIVHGSAVIEIGVPNDIAAGNWVRALSATFQVQAEVFKGPDWVTVRVAQGGYLAQAAGLLDGQGRPVSGLRGIATASDDLAAAAWRAAASHRGSRTRFHGVPGLRIDCPDLDVATSMVRLARRLSVLAHQPPANHGLRVYVRGRQLVVLLTAIGDVEQATRVDAELADLEGRRRSNVFREANAARTATAAAQAVKNVKAALKTLADKTVPAALEEAGKLRLAHPYLSWLELGLLADPPVTKDVIRCRVRRLTAMGRTVTRTG